MRDIIVALDLETTGLNAQEDKIIEIGAVKFRGSEVIDTYRMLIDPERPIPPRVTAITGIRPEDVSGAPKLRDVLADVIRFVGDYPILGHNIGFDLDFLRYNGAPFTNPTLDTYELASVLLPTTPRYNLNALMQDLQLVAEGDYHSALTDARATAQVYGALWDKMLNTLPISALQDIVRATQALDWRGRLAFEAALRERAAEIITSEHVTAPTKDDALQPSTSIAPLVPTGIVGQTDASPSLEAIFAPSGTLAHAFPNYEARPAQLEMAQTVRSALADSQHLLIEAPPGTGKSLAYLIPALQFAAANAERVIIALHSADLQQQLIDQDIPAAQAALGITTQTAVLKGRDHYLCPRRLETLRRRLPTSIEELRVLAKILAWGEAASTGDRDHISLRGPAEYIAWTRLSAQDEGCALSRCETQMHGTCPFYRARRAAESAHLVLVTHGLLMSDSMPDKTAADGSTPNSTGRSGVEPVLPEYRYVIVDEAHHLEDDATFARGVRLDLAAFQRQMADLGTRDSGLIGDVAQVVGAVLTDPAREKTLARLSLIADSLKAMRYHGEALFGTLAAVLASSTGGRSDYISQLRISDDLREKATFEPTRVVWDVLREFTGSIGEVMLRLSQSLHPLQEKYAIPELPDLLASTAAASQHLATMHRLLEAFIEKPDSNTIYWLEATQDQSTPTLRTAPLHIGPLAEQRLWQPRRSVILSGATLQTSGTFDYLRERLNAPGNIRERLIDTGSDPANSDEKLTLIYLPNDIPEPQDKNRYQQAVERSLIELATATDGRLLVLFTNYAQLRQTVQAITPRLALGHFTVFDQSDGTSKQALLTGFAAAEKAVMFGTKSSWEEVELPPDALAVLAITRLPFSAPGEPVIGARSEALNDAFNSYSVPDAVLRFRQGFERLSRARHGQRGVVTILDRRILSKGYGQTFLDSLPACTIQHGPLADLPAAAKTWLNTK